jgi:hypothetical protein
MTKLSRPRPLAQLSYDEAFAELDRAIVNCASALDQLESAHEQLHAGLRAFTKLTMDLLKRLDSRTPTGGSLQ